MNKRNKRKCVLCGKTGIKKKKFCSRLCANRYQHQSKSIVSKERLKELYIDSKLSVAEISNLYNCSNPTVYTYLHKYKIPLRPLYEDKTNQIIDNTKIIAVSSNYIPVSGKHVIWQCECECGKKFERLSHNFKKNLSNKCKECAKRDRLKDKELNNNIMRKLEYMAKIRNYEFTVSKEYLWELFLKQNRKCALTNIIIHFGKNKFNSKRKGMTASLDRIDNNKGYIKGNVQWVHKLVNIMKSDYEQRHFIKWCELIYKHSLLKEQIPCNPSPQISLDQPNDSPLMSSSFAV